MTMIHEVKCDFCGKRAEAKSVDDPPDHVTYEEPDNWSVILSRECKVTMHLCPSCIKQLEKYRKR